MRVTVAQQFLGREPIVEFDPFEAAALDPQVVGLLLNLGLGRFMPEVGSEGMAQHGELRGLGDQPIVGEPQGFISAQVGKACAYLALFGYFPDQ